MPLLRLWREKRGELEPEDLSGNLIVQLGAVTEDLNRRWYEANTGEVVTDVQQRRRHPALSWMGATLDGLVKSTEAVFEASHAAVVVLGGGCGGEVHAPASAQHVGCRVKDVSSVDHHGRRQVGRDHDPRRSCVPAPPGHCGEEVLAMRSEWRGPY